MKVSNWLLILPLLILAGIVHGQGSKGDEDVDKLIEAETKAAYEVANQEKPGRKPGPDRKLDLGALRLRFVRLEHGGEGWNDGMDETGADVNMLQAFAKDMGMTKVAKAGESHSIALLARYPEIPPFVYLTGTGIMGRVRRGEVAILREYCLKGGMLIADAGSAKFHASFVAFMREVFPDKQLVEIAADDVIYQIPYAFPEGAPAFWHHGGRKPLGIKDGGRWVVFYHPGDMNDAWKSPGFSDVTPEMREAARTLGVNVLWYAFREWNDSMGKGTSR